MHAVLGSRSVTRHVFSLSVVALLSLGTASPVAAAWSLQFSWEWDIYNLDTSRVDGGDQTFTSSSGVLRQAVSEERSSVAAGGNNSTVTAVGVGDLGTQGFGALAQVRSHINPWTERQRPNPLKTEVVSEIRFSDRVVALSPIQPIGTDLSFNFGPGFLTGTLTTPSELGAVGGAGVALIFQAKPVIGNAPTVTRVFEEVLTAGIHLGSPSIPSGLLRGLPLVNGMTYDWTLTMKVNASIIPGIFSNVDPPKSTSSSSFGDTYYWGGLEGVFDTQGNPVADVAFTSDAGFDWVTVGAVPEPESYAMLLAGLGLLGFVAGRRTRPAALVCTRSMA